MISFEDFIIEDGTPIYMQILRYVKRGVVSGTVKNGDELPSRRVLSALLGVNPNTIQKAYHILEEEKIIQSHSGAKSYMSFDEKRAEEIRIELHTSDVKAVVNAMKQMGLDREEALSLIERYWNE